MVFGVEKPPQKTLTKIGERDIIYTWLSKRALPTAARQRRTSTQTSAYWHAQLGESCPLVQGMQARGEAGARKAGYIAAGSANAARTARIGPACAPEARLRRLPSKLHVQDDTSVPRCPPCLPRARNELVGLTRV